MIIYKATNLINNKIYIGQTRESLDVRIGKHIRSAKSEQNRGLTSIYFHNALLKYGVENFKWEIIDTATTDEELNEKEIYWIAAYDAMNKEIGYNEASGGKSGFKSQAVKDKISQKKKENWQDPELAQRMRDGLAKATTVWQQHCEENRIEKVCKCCGKIFKVPPHMEKQKYCSQECANEVNIKKATVAAAEANHKSAELKHSAFKDEVLEWSINNSDLVLSCPKNKISTTLIDLQQIANKYNMKDWRVISNAICGKPAKKALIEYLQDYVKRYAVLV